jgi:hypothetical protein
MGSVLAEGELVSMRPMLTIWTLGMTEAIGPYSCSDVVRMSGYLLCPPLHNIKVARREDRREAGASLRKRPAQPYC